MFYISVLNLWILIFVMGFLFAFDDRKWHTTDEQKAKEAKEWQDRVRAAEEAKRRREARAAMAVKYRKVPGMIACFVVAFLGILVSQRDLSVGMGLVVMATVVGVVEWKKPLP